MALTALFEHIGAKLKIANPWLDCYSVNCIQLPDKKNGGKGEVVNFIGEEKEYKGIDDSNGAAFYIRTNPKFTYAPQRAMGSCGAQYEVTVPFKFVFYAINQDENFNPLKIENLFTNNLREMNFRDYTGGERKVKLVILNSNTDSFQVFFEEVGKKFTSGSNAVCVSIECQLKFLSTTDCEEQCGTSTGTDILTTFDFCDPEVIARLCYAQVVCLQNRFGGGGGDLTCAKLADCDIIIQLQDSLSNKISCSDLTGCDVIIGFENRIFALENAGFITCDTLPSCSTITDISDRITGLENAGFITCQTLIDCQTIIDIQNLLPNADQKAALDNANSPDSTNPFATMSDISGFPTTLAQVLIDGNITGGTNVILSDGDIISSADGYSFFRLPNGAGSVNNAGLVVVFGAITAAQTAGQFNSAISWANATVSGNFNVTAASSAVNHSVLASISAPQINIDTTNTVATNIINIGATNADVINIGRAGATVNILGSALYEYAANQYVLDKLITLNYGGAAASGIGVGFEIEENNIITGYFKTNAGRNGFSFLTPSVAYKVDLLLSALSADHAYILPNADGTFALAATTLAGYGITDAQPLDGDLTAIAGLTPSDDDIIQRKAGAWTNRTIAQYKTDLGLAFGSGSGQYAEGNDSRFTDSRFWITVPGTPVRVGNTSFTITDTANANLYDMLLGRTTVLKWTDTGVTKMAMVVSATYSSNTVTVTIIGDTLTANATMNTFKYSTEKCKPVRFIIAGTIATGTNLSITEQPQCSMKVFGADAIHGTAGTTNATTYDINKNGTTMFTTKVSIASGATSGNGFTADSGTETSFGDVITLDCDSVSTTAPIDVYVYLYMFPVKNQYLN